MTERKPLDAQFVGSVNQDAMRALSDVKARIKWSNSRSGSPVTTNMLCAEIARLNLDREWQLISTAQKMKVVLLWAATDIGINGTIKNWKMQTGYWSTGHNAWCWEGHEVRGYDVQPTHWMPLPLPPPMKEGGQ